MTHLDLFTGIGGFHLAAQWSGFQTVGFSEIEPYCCALLAERWPEIPNYGDIRTTDFSGLRGRITVCSAGVPCQPASLAGKRRGKDDDRWLWEAALDVVECVGPTWCIFENPVGILSMDEFAGIYLRLESIGYEVAPPLSVPANAVGAKHRRVRVFIVANRPCELLNGSRDARPRWRDESTDGSEALADADRAGLEEHESREQGQLAAVVRSSGINGARESFAQFRRVAHDVPHWPYGPMPSPLSKERIPNRSHRLKALGNACCPYQCLPFFAAIAQVERGL